MLTIGVSEVDITPAPGLRMAGMLNPHQAQGVHWPLYARLILFEDGLRRAAILVLDTLLEA